MKDTKGYLLLKKGEKIWEEHWCLDHEYCHGNWFDGGVLWHMGDKCIEYDIYSESSNKLTWFVYDYLDFLDVKVKRLNIAKEEFSKQMERTDESWNERLSDELKKLPKETVIRNFEERYAKILAEYQELISTLEEWKEEDLKSGKQFTDEERFPVTYGIRY